MAAELATMEQALERLDANVAVAVPKLSEGRRSERNLGERRQPLVNEPLQSAQRRTLVTRHVGLRQQLAKRECVCERESAHLPRGHLRVLNMAGVDRPLETSVSCALAGHRLDRWGDGVGLA